MKSNSKKRVKRYTNSLRKAPNIEPHCYYVSDNHKNLKEVDSLNVRHNGVTFETVVKELDKKHKELEIIKHTVQACESVLTGVLLNYGYNTPNTDLNALIGDISQLNIIKPNTKYIGYKVENGYVVGYGYDIICVKDGNQPDDFDKGYWQFDGKAWLLDEDKFKQLWSRIL